MQTDFIQFSRQESFYSIRDDISKQKAKYVLEIEVFIQKDVSKDIYFYVEEKLYEMLFEGEKILFLGKKVESNKYIFFFLSKKKNGFEETLDYVMNEFSELSYVVFVEKCSKKYLEQLTPTLLEIQESKNLKELSMLPQELLYTKQKVAFFISYNDTEISTFFLQSVKKLGYIVENDGETPRKNFTKALKLSKNIYLDAQTITQASNELIMLCSDYHFLFEGWTCKASSVSPPIKGIT